MKKLFTILIPICILSFIAAGVLDIIFGRNESPDIPTDSNISGENELENKVTINDTQNTHTFELEALDNITFMLSGVNAEIIPSNGEKIYIMVHNNDAQREVSVALDAKVNTSTIEIHPTHITFSTIKNGLLNWLEDVFNPSPKCNVWVMVPQNVYKNLAVKQGSGIVSINSIKAEKNNIHIGSGEFSLTYPDLFTSEELNLKLGSGKASIKKAATMEYDFDIGSGEYDISGLKGTGNIEMGSGNGMIDYDSYTGLVLKKGSGNLDISVPLGTPMRLFAELGSGDIEVNLDDTKQTIKDSGEYYFGNVGTPNFLRVNNGSGNISVRNSGTLTAEN